ncbi:FecR family protein [Caulobacter endophyticus]|uniref:FecR family protein n=1 Tax=Caulobacter endophyticus TaxID=2172652 RepID=UPI00240EB2EA|nr:FecR domain-containing protein [Caulobacter endophyticus]MDG2527851.1 FecR domain-containing protein [Caulobacter endophyticus]
MVKPERDLEAVRRQAADWLARLRSDSRTQGDEAGFKAWLDRSEHHRTTFDALTSTWELAGALRHDSQIAIAAKPKPPAPLARRAVLAGVGVSAIGLGWLAFAPEVYATGVGETRTLHLDDGSSVLLDADSRLSVRIDGRQRRAGLDKGRAFFRAARDPARPFVVAADGREIIGEGGDAFGVSVLSQTVSVVAVEGQVLVMTPGQPSGRITASAGQRVLATGQGPARRETADVQSATAWRFGQAVFDDQTLVEALAEMNRYSRRRIELSDPALESLRISGVYKAGDNEAFARSVATLLDLDVRASGGGLLIEPRGGA